MSAPPNALVDVDAMSVDMTPPPDEPGEIHHAPSHSHRGRRHPRRRRWNRGGPPTYQRESSNSDAMSAFTRFFRAEAEASKPSVTFVRSPHLTSPVPSPPEELATRKEAHAFNQMVRAERKQDYARPRPAPAPNMSLDNRRGPGHPRSSRGHTSGNKPPGGSASWPYNAYAVKYSPQPPPARSPSTHMTAAQLIAAVVEEDARKPPTASPSPASVADDTGRDVSEIVAAAERLDLEQEARLHNALDGEFLGKLLMIGLLVSNLLMTYLLAASLGAM
ncbi:hypothetical protein C8R48DRAFT_669038 [Suillus tomentosus]|nr:hypothetical protein C8R48DRAFT_669038 [Suillus tomentosus]